tara:strand:+ start:55 stop:333 length:279 start_codon:yes stop_codon:yes gene_type:complete
MKIAKAFLAILALGSAAHLSASESRLDVNIGIGTNSGNYCAGGLEDRKLIELGERIDNATKQTTVLECRATGGTPLIMPDLPEPKADREALA